MSFANFDTFVIVVSFINISWEPCQLTIGIFEVHNIARATMANWENCLLDSFSLLDKVIAYVKVEGFDFNILTYVLTSIVYCFTF
jgi:hypothetical protein